ncbi:hypothetical protein BDI4_40011 [Burkholderia diffusa]|nr:hypothetical protein BDI4_40011 [Burkholderia diffusa]
MNFRERVRLKMGELKIVMGDLTIIYRILSFLSR